MGTPGVSKIAFPRPPASKTSNARAAAARAWTHHSGLSFSGMSLMMIDNRKPPRAPPRCPNKSMLGVIVDIVVTEINMKTIQMTVRSRAGPKPSHDKAISASHTPIRPNPAVEAPTANLYGSYVTLIKLPKRPHAK